MLPTSVLNVSQSSTWQVQRIEVPVTGPAKLGSPPLNAAPTGAPMPKVMIPLRHKGAAQGPPPRPPPKPPPYANSVWAPDPEDARRLGAMPVVKPPPHVVVQREVAALERNAQMAADYEASLISAIAKPVALSNWSKPNVKAPPQALAVGPKPNFKAPPQGLVVGPLVLNPNEESSTFSVVQAKEPPTCLQGPAHVDPKRIRFRRF